MDPAMVTLGIFAATLCFNIATWFISPTVSEWLKRASNGKRTISDTLMDLELRFMKLKKMLAEEFQANPGGKLKSSGIEKLIRKLKAAMYKAEDIIDSVDYLCLKPTTKGKSAVDYLCLKPSTKGKSAVDYLCLIPSIKGKSAKTDSPHNASTSQNNGITKDDFSFLKPLESDLKKTLKDIQILMNEMDKILPFSDMAPCRGSSNNTPNKSLTVSKPPEVVFGREDDLEKIQKMLHDTLSSCTAKCYSVIGIHGIPGSGKTTLAQYVSNKEEKEKYFNLFMWIKVSQEFDVAAILAEMLEAASEDQKSCNIKNLDTLIKKLEKNLNDKKFFLVLDDVWCDKSAKGQHKRDLLLRALNAGASGSKILVTTRDKDAATAFGVETETLIKISDLKDKEYFEMFMSYALNTSKINEGERHERIGREIAAKLKHSPLAARTVAGQLRGKPIDYWERALRSDLLKDTMKEVLWWSYQQLDEHARQCFAYCSMFPRGHKFERDELVHQWMAQAFLPRTNGTDDQEDIGHFYFDILLSCSFIQPIPNHNAAFMIHDLMHDLAQRVAGNDCYRIEEGKAGPISIPIDVRHLFIESFDQQVFREQVLNLVELRTIFVRDLVGKKMTVEDWNNLVKNLKKLRAVHVPGWYGMVTEHIGELEHLRYLSFRLDDNHKKSYRGIGGKIILPSTFDKLYHLQKLSAPDFEVDYSKVEGMCNLVNLQYINTAKGTVNFPDMGRLKLLRELQPVFTVRKEKGYELHQLEKMNNIRGSLCIGGLENVENKEDALLADLANKKYITCLSLDWKRDDDEGDYYRKPKRQKVGGNGKLNAVVPMRDPDPQDEILEALRPPSQITSLVIRNYNGSKCPSWLSLPTLPSSLKELRIEFCNPSLKDHCMEHPIVKKIVEIVD